MFIAGGVVVGVVIYGAHSNHSDHYNYSEYSDADALLEIQKKESELKRTEQKLEMKKQRATKHLDSELEELKEQLHLQDTVTVDNLNKKVDEKYKEILAEAIEEDKKKLHEIDNAINKIIALQLKNS